MRVRASRRYTRQRHKCVHAGQMRIGGHCVTNSTSAAGAHDALGVISRANVPSSDRCDVPELMRRIISHRYRCCRAVTCERAFSMRSSTNHLLRAILPRSANVSANCWTSWQVSQLATAVASRRDRNCSKHVHIAMVGRRRGDEHILPHAVQVLLKRLAALSDGGHVDLPYPTDWMLVLTDRQEAGARPRFRTQRGHRRHRREGRPMSMVAPTPSETSRATLTVTCVYRPRRRIGCLVLPCEHLHILRAI
jgi:hypothetical protein